MLRRCLGTSAIEVSQVGLGGNVFGPPRLDLGQTRAIIDAALELGVNFVDTARVYGEGLSEEYIGEALRGRRQHMVVATKFHLRDLGDITVRARIRAHCEESLRRLKTDWIDLFQLHQPNPDVTADELIEVLTELVNEGTIRAVGCCNYASWRLGEALERASALKASAMFVSVQDQYNLLDRRVEAEVLHACRHYAVSLLPYFPLAGGFLTGKYQPGQPPPPGTRGAAGSPIVRATNTQSNWDRVQQLRALAAAHGRTVGELAIAWLLAEPRVASVIAGVSSVDQLRANVTAADWRLSSEVHLTASRITQPDPDTLLSPELPSFGEPTHTVHWT